MTGQTHWTPDDVGAAARFKQQGVWHDFVITKHHGKFVDGQPVEKAVGPFEDFEAFMDWEDCYELLLRCKHPG